MVDDNVRRETIGGQAHERPWLEGAGQEAAMTVEVALREYSEENGGWVSDGPREVAFDFDNIVVPDVVYLAPNREFIIEDRMIRGIPTIVVDVFPSTDVREGSVKTHLYASFGVPEYWVVDCEAKMIERWSQPDAGSYSKIEVFSDDLWSEVLTDFMLPLDDVFAAETAE